MQAVKLPERISRVILRYPNLILKINIKINDDKGSFHNQYTFNDNVYIDLNPMVTLVLEMPKDNDGIYDKTRGFLIGQGNIGTVVKTMKRVLKNIYTQDIFALQNNNVIVYEDMATKYSDKITIPRLGQVILIKPAVIYDENETSYEGVHIYINRLTNVIPLSIDEYENLVYTLENIDIFTYSQLLLNYYISYVNDMVKGHLSGSKHRDNNNNKSINWNDKPKTHTISNFTTTKEDDIFKDL